MDFYFSDSENENEDCGYRRRVDDPSPPPPLPELEVESVLHSDGQYMPISTDDVFGYADVVVGFTGQAQLTCDISTGKVFDRYAVKSIQATATARVKINYYYAAMMPTDRSLSFTLKKSGFSTGNTYSWSMSIGSAIYSGMSDGVSGSTETFVVDVGAAIDAGQLSPGGNLLELQIMFNQSNRTVTFEALKTVLPVGMMNLFYTAQDMHAGVNVCGGSCNYTSEGRQTAAPNNTCCCESRVAFGNVEFPPVFFWCDRGLFKDNYGSTGDFGGEGGEISQRRFVPFWVGPGSNIPHGEVLDEIAISFGHNGGAASLLGAISYNV